MVACGDPKSRHNSIIINRAVVTVEKANDITVAGRINPTEISGPISVML